MVPDRVVSTLFFGGGTPSLMEPDTVAAIIDTTRSLWRSVNDPEITLEANPTSVEAGRFQAYRDAGVNRVSIGIQALEDAALRQLGRLHNVAEAKTAFEIGQETFEKVSFDLIYARQDQSAEAWRKELGEALAMGSDHLSLYQLTIEDGTAFGDRHKNGALRGLPSEDLSVELYEMTQDLCEKAGMPAYEVSNHARPGQASRHNMIYWTGGDYVGIGPGAHGRISIGHRRIATETELLPGRWLQNVENGRGDVQAELTQQDAFEERVLMGLRVVEGLDLDTFPSQFYNVLYNKIRYLDDISLAELHGTQLRVTPKGRPLLNSIIRHLLT